MSNKKVWKLVVKSSGLKLVDDNIITDYRKLSTKERIMKMNNLTSKEQYEDYVDSYGEDQDDIEQDAEVSVEYTNKSAKSLVDSSYGWFDEDKIEVGSESINMEYRLKVGRLLRNALNKAKVKPSYA